RLPCVKCNSPESQMHHEDYSRPRDVTWLCRPCHDRLHRERGSKRGRPSRGRTKAPPVMVRLSPAERADAQEKARLAGMSLSGVMREAIAAFNPVERIAPEAPPADGAIREPLPAADSTVPGILVVYDE